MKEKCNMQIEVIFAQEWNNWNPQIEVKQVQEWKNREISQEFRWLI